MTSSIISRFASRMEALCLHKISAFTCSAVLPGEAIIVHDDPEDNAEKQDYVPDYMTITRAVGRNIHYLTA